MGSGMKILACITVLLILLLLTPLLLVFEASEEIGSVTGTLINKSHKNAHIQIIPAQKVGDVHMPMRTIYHPENWYLQYSVDGTTTSISVNEGEHNKAQIGSQEEFTKRKTKYTGRIRYKK